MKNYEWYDYIHNTGLRASGGVSILIRKCPSKNEHLLASNCSLSNLTQNCFDLFVIFSDFMTP